ncbi:MAG: methionine synthase [Chloroflexi bacterium]|nr:methionine synthase [Chloroflexota bacterium]
MADRVETKLKRLVGQGRATAIGSLPHRSATDAVDLVTGVLPEIPFWPQLPRRSFLENMYVQFTAGLPGVVVDRENERVYVDPSRAVDELEELYSNYLGGNAEPYGLTPDYSAGFEAFLETRNRLGEAVAIKGQVTGPVSLGLQVTDKVRRSILYDEQLADAATKLLSLKARWQEKALTDLHSNTVIWLDEPYLHAVGSVFVPLDRQQVVAQLEEVLSGLSGLKGVHCCGNTDWSLLLGTSTDIISFDAYQYARSLALYPEEVTSFLGRGGIIAWGIVPNTPEALSGQTAEALLQRLEEAMDLLVQKGLQMESLVISSLITPTCGLGSQTPEVALQVLTLTAETSRMFRAKYGLI